jgi:hypothetical protein
VAYLHVTSCSMTLHMANCFSLLTRVHNRHPQGILIACPLKNSVCRHQERQQLRFDFQIFNQALLIGAVNEELAYIQCAQNSLRTGLINDQR